MACAAGNGSSIRKDLVPPQACRQSYLAVRLLDGAEMRSCVDCEVAAVIVVVAAAASSMFTIYVCFVVACVLDGL